MGFKGYNLASSVYRVEGVEGESPELLGYVGLEFCMDEKVEYAHVCWNTRPRSQVTGRGPSMVGLGFRVQGTGV